MIPVLLLGFNLRERTRAKDFAQVCGDEVRGWDDVAIAAGMAGYDAFPVAPYLVTNRYRRQDAFFDFKDNLTSLERSHRVRLSRPWEAFEATDLFPRRPRVSMRFDDAGRAYLLGLCFRAIGGVAPGMLFWLAPALAALVLLWLVVDAVRSRLPWLGFGVAVLVGVSAYCQDVLMLSYSAAGFYLVAVLAALAYAVGVLGGAPDGFGLLARSAGTGVVLALCLNARSVSAAVLPGIGCVAFIGVMGLRTTLRRRVALLLAAAALLAVPTVLLRTRMADDARLAVERFGGETLSASHDFWTTLWQGLGDFDRTHGHIFSDSAALEIIHQNGGRDLVSDKSEAIMRRLVVESIRSEPFWFAGLLGRRLAATISFHKLWPNASPSSPGFYPSASANEGVTDAYWARTEQADVFRLGLNRLEVPAALLPAVLLILAGVWLRDRARGNQEPSAAVGPIVAVAALAALTGPVLTTTAGAYEPEAFVIVVFAAAAGLVQRGLSPIFSGGGRP